MMIVIIMIVMQFKEWRLWRHKQADKKHEMSHIRLIFEKMTKDEINYSLCRFVCEVRKQDGTEYPSKTTYETSTSRGVTSPPVLGGQTLKCPPFPPKFPSFCICNDGKYEVQKICHFDA